MTEWCLERDLSWEKIASLLSFLTENWRRFRSFCVWLSCQFRLFKPRIHTILHFPSFENTFLFHNSTFIMSGIFAAPRLLYKWIKNCCAYRKTFVRCLKIPSPPSSYATSREVNGASKPNLHQSPFENDMDNTIRSREGLDAKSRRPIFTLWVP